MKVGQSRSLTLFLCALPLILVVACAPKAPKDPAGALRAAVNKNVADKARADKMLAVVAQLEAAAADVDTLVADERALLVPMLSDYGSSRTDVEKALGGFNLRREAIARRFLELHASFKVSATQAEWDQLRKPEMELIKLGASKGVGQTAAPKKGSEP
jgi:hypothetical protein